MMIVIVGPGPAGLYLAISLKKLGLDVLLVGLRAGIYTRPGHLFITVFKRAEDQLGKTFWPEGAKRPQHIKDLERALYQEALSLGVVIQNKDFLSLYHDEGGQRGVILEDIHKQREKIAADYVFDCSGSARVVINNLNALDPSVALPIETRVRNHHPFHFLANVYMSDDDAKALRTGLMARPDRLPHPDNLLRSMNKLHDLGWTSLARPSCMLHSLGKQKRLLYFYIPEGLNQRDYDAYLSCLMESYTAPLGLKTPTYRQLKPSRHYASKPRFMPFNTGSAVLREVVACSQFLPWVIPAGDALVDPVYALGKGISNGMLWIEILCGHLQVESGQIQSFNHVAYSDIMKKQLAVYLEEVDHYDGQKAEHSTQEASIIEELISQRSAGGDSALGVEFNEQLRVHSSLSESLSAESADVRAQLLGARSHSAASAEDLARIAALRIRSSSLPFLNGSDPHLERNSRNVIVSLVNEMCAIS